jgi:hypothetical protein
VPPLFNAQQFTFVSKQLTDVLTFFLLLASIYLYLLSLALQISYHCIGDSITDIEEVLLNIEDIRDREK